MCAYFVGGGPQLVILTALVPWCVWSVEIANLTMAVLVKEELLKEVSH
jgi:hypothetical protein